MNEKDEYTNGDPRIVIETILREGYITNDADAHLAFVVGDDTVDVEVTDDGDVPQQRWRGRFTTLSIASLCNWYLQQFPGMQHLRRQLRPPVEETPVVVCLCGSTRHYMTFKQAKYQEALDGKIVLSVGVFVNAGPDNTEYSDCTSEQKAQLDELHLRQIDLADEVLVLNVDGYVGDGTHREVEYALEHGKVLRWWEEDKKPDWVDDTRFPALAHRASEGDSS